MLIGSTKTIHIAPSKNFSENRYTNKHCNKNTSPKSTRSKKVRFERNSNDHYSLSEHNYS